MLTKSLTSSVFLAPKNHTQNWVRIEPIPPNWRPLLFLLIPFLLWKSYARPPLAPLSSTNPTNAQPLPRANIPSFHSQLLLLLPSPRNLFFPSFSTNVNPLLASSPIVSSSFLPPSTQTPPSPPHRPHLRHHLHLHPRCISRVLVHLFFLCQAHNWFLCRLNLCCLDRPHRQW